MKGFELHSMLHQVRQRGRLLGGMLALALSSVLMSADTPIASSNFAGVENPLSENGSWVSISAYSPYGTVFQKNNGALLDRLSPLNHGAARTTVAVPADQYSEIVVGHLENANNNVGAIARVQTSGASAESVYLWWASLVNGGNYLYRLDAHIPDPNRGITYTATALTPTSPVVNGDRIRLIARGSVLYGIKNGVRDFIYNTATNTIKFPTGATGIMSYADGAVTNAIISSWSTGPAPVSTGTWASTNFAGTENPLDEGDRWYPLPAYAGFRKAGGMAMGLGSSHNASGVWSIAPGQKQYSEVTLSSVAGGGGGPIVRIDRTNPGQTGWLLFLFAASPSSSGIYKMTPDGNFAAVQQFTPTIVPGDKWRLSANGNVLEVFRNGVSQLTYTTDGSYPTGDVGIEAYTQAFTFSGWEGGDAGGVTPVPTVSSFTPTSGPVGTSVTIAGTNFTGATAVTFNGANATFSVTSDTTIQATVPAGATTGSVSVTTAAGTATGPGAFTVTATPPNPPTITSFTPATGPAGTSVQINGTNFTGATAVKFNGVSAAFSLTSDTTIQATVPAGATTGPVSVTTAAGTATSPGAFTVTATPPSPPTITSFTPAAGPVGTSVQISGTNFTGATAVKFNGVSATFSVTSATAIQATVPQGATSGALTVTTSGGTGTSPSAFTVMPSPPTITSFTPVSGQVGTTVTISGTNFTGATAVAFNSRATSFTQTSDTQIQAIVPTGATSGPLTVTTPGGTATSSGSFTVVPSGPTITSFTPTSGLVGTAVTINGTNFAGATALRFNGVSAAFTVTSPTVIQATVPAAATTGPLSVTTPGGTATSTTNFTVKVTLNAAKAGNGSGTVTSTSSPSSPTQINCGTTCSVSYDSGTVVTLTATPATGSTVTGWTGCDTVAGATCTVGMNAARSVTATFTLQQFALSVRKTNTLGVGDGTITSTSSPASPTQINCGGTCSVLYNYGTVVTLTATPNAVSLFNGWSGCDSSSGATCTVTIGAAKSVTASFLP